MGQGAQDIAGGRERAVILVIDDDNDNLAIVSTLLEEHGYTIFVAEDGESGMERARRVLPDLILMDVMMPGIDGFETCRRMKQLDEVRDIPVIFMTALAEIEHKVRGFQAGAVDYVTKPLQQEEVLARVSVHLRLRELARKLQDANELLEMKVAERTQTLARINEELQKEVAERKQVQEALASLNRGLEQRVDEEVEKNREKDRILFHNARLAALGELLSNIGHQWRQPLNSLSLLLQEADLDCREGRLDRDSFIALVHKGMEKISYLSSRINILQTFFLPESEPREFDPFEMVEKAVALVRASYEESGIEITLVNHCQVRITGYAVEFSQAVVNILNNARDVLVERETPAPAVVVRCASSRGKNAITVTDNAGGVPEEILDKIFDPYFTTKFKAQGTGLGLYMAKMIIERNMGGRLYVSNVPGGAEFTIELNVTQ